MKVVRLSTPRTGLIYTPGNIPATHFCSRSNRPQGTVWPEGLRQCKIPIIPSEIKPAAFWILAQYICEWNVFK